MNEFITVIKGLFDQKNRVKTISIIFIFFLLSGIYAFITNYCSRMGEQQAYKNTVEESADTAVSDDEKPSISQHTEGENSPAIVSDNATVTYGPDTKKP